MKNNKNGIKAAVLTMSMVQMATNGIASVLASIAGAFPEVDTAAVQLLMTFPGIFIMAVSVLFAAASAKIDKKMLAVGGLVCCVLAGILPFLYHESLVFLFVCEAMLGSGIGLIIPTATGTIAEYFEGHEKEQMMGYQTAAANIGSMLMTFVAGALAVKGWHWAFLVYLISIPGLLCTILFYPKKTGKTGKEVSRAETVSPTGKEVSQAETVFQTGKADDGTKKVGFILDVQMLKYAAIACLGMMIFYIGPTNLALLFEERQLGSSVAAGTATTLILLAGSLAGFLFGVLSGKLEKQTISLGFLMLFIGYLLIDRGGSVRVVYLGSFISGISNSMIMPQCMIRAASSEEKGGAAMSIVFAAANLGGFIAPVFTGMADKILKTSLPSEHFRFMGVLALILAAAFGLVFLIEKRKRGKA